MQVPLNRRTNISLANELEKITINRSKVTDLPLLKTVTTLKLF